MEPKPRTYRARVKLEIAGAARPRYFTSHRAAVRMFRDVSMRLMSQGKPPRNAEITPVRGWQGLIEPCSLTVSAAGGVVVRRAANEDDFKAIPAPIWPGVQP